MATDFDDLEVMPSGKEKPVAKEFRIHWYIIKHIMGVKDVIPPAFHAIAIHNYQGRNKNEGFYLKMLGVIAGWPDITVYFKGKCSGCGVERPDFGFIEVKTENGILSTVQRKIRGKLCGWLGARYEIARSVKEAHEVCIKWGLTPIHHAIKEPNLQSEKQKFAANHAFFARGDE